MMKKQILILLVCVLLPSVALSKIFEAKVILGEHRTNNPHGEWAIEKKKATDKKYTNEIKTEKLQGNTYNYLLAKESAKATDEYPETTDIEIIDIPYYKKVFIGQMYYKFYWSKKKNKGYFDDNADKINATISHIPTVTLRVKNHSKKKLILERIESKNIFQSGGMANYQAGELVPKVKKGAMEMSYNKTDTMIFPKGYMMPAGKVINFPLSLWVKNASHGDGSGNLIYALEMYYIEEGKKKREVLVIINQADAEGYDSGAIVPVN